MVKRDYSYDPNNSSYAELNLRIREFVLHFEGALFTVQINSRKSSRASKDRVSRLAKDSLCLSFGDGFVLAWACSPSITKKKFNALSVGN